jgi:hypothetical protein
MLCSSLVLSSGSCSMAWSACSRHEAASMLAPRPTALAAAWGRYATAFSHSSPRTA